MGQHHEIHLGDEGSVANALRIVMRNYFSTQLLAGAARMAELVRRIEDDHTGESRFDLEHRGYVLSSVLSAVGFLEAMVNELFQDAHDDHAPDGGAITPLDANTRLLMAEYWRSTEQGKGRALDKYQALLRFAGEPALDQGAQLFQDASLAVQLRNAIAHYRPQDLSADTPSLMEQRLVLQPEIVTWLVRGQGRGADEGGHRRSWCCANNQRSDGGRWPQRRG
jgi:hypothetical protein